MQKTIYNLEKLGKGRGVVWSEQCGNVEYSKGESRFFFLHHYHTTNPTVIQWFAPKVTTCIMNKRHHLLHKFYARLIEMNGSLPGRTPWCSHGGLHDSRASIAYFASVPCISHWSLPWLAESEYKLCKITYIDGKYFSASSSFLAQLVLTESNFYI